MLDFCSNRYGKVITGDFNMNPLKREKKHILEYGIFLI